MKIGSMEITRKTTTEKKGNIPTVRQLERTERDLDAYEDSFVAAYGAIIQASPDDGIVHNLTIARAELQESLSALATRRNRAMTRACTAELSRREHERARHV